VRLPVFYQGAGAAGIQVAPAHLCGQGAVAWCWGKMPTPTFLKEDDYQFLRGAGIKMAYGVGKIASSTPPATSRIGASIPASLPRSPTIKA